MKRRGISAFSLSFLDIMFCGFGAVVLLVLIINTGIVKTRETVFTDLRADVIKLESEVLIGKENLVEVKNSIETINQQRVITEGQSRKIQQTKTRIESGIESLSKATAARNADIKQLKTDLKSLDKKSNQKARQAEESKGTRVYEISGAGDRQYLTGLKLSGKRTLILIDSSASMLDETVVNIIRRRNMSKKQKLNSLKWQRSLAVARWLVANLVPDGQFALYSFNTAVHAVNESGNKGWLSSADSKSISSAIKGLNKLIPENGTSLHRAFSIINQFQPKPDNIILLTDGLPTQAEKKPLRSSVSANRRLKLFTSATRLIPAGIPVNTILMPMEGDLYAPSAYWKLAIKTKGSFLTPTRDWP